MVHVVTNISERVKNVNDDDDENEDENDAEKTDTQN